MDTSCRYCYATVHAVHVELDWFEEFYDKPEWPTDDVREISLFGAQAKTFGTN